MADDAFITFRYVRNFLAGNGLVYNAGERVEGYTNFLWAMALALPAALGMKIELAAKVLGLISGAAAIVLATAIAHLWMGERLSRRNHILLFLPGALLAASGPFAMWTFGGLETVFFTFLLMLSTLAYLSSDRPRAISVTGALLALVVMTRPDGIVFLGATLAHAGFAGTRGRVGEMWKQRISRCILLIAAFSVVYLPYFIWRYTYYGYLFPNTFYAKVGGGTDFLGRGLKYLWLFLSTYGFVPIASAATFFYARMVQPSTPLEDKDRRIFSFLAVQVLLYTLFIVYVGGDQLVMKRFFVPLLPAIYLMSTRGVSQLFFAPHVEGKTTPGWRIGFALAVAAALVVVLLPSFAGHEHDRVFKAEKPADADRKKVGEWLKQNLGPDATIAMIPAGIAPFYSGLRTIDLVGLNDVQIAHTAVPDFGKGAAGHEKHNSAYVLGRRPELIFLGACRIWPEKLDAHSLLNYYWIYGRLVPGNREILQLDECKKNYAPCAARLGEGYIYFLKRNDFVFPAAEPIDGPTGTG